MSYSKAKDCWSGLDNYNLSGKMNKDVTNENYVPPVTLSLPEWRNYIASGNNVLLGSGGVIPGGIVSTPFGGGAVYRGRVRQGYGWDY
jgi:hypothetical protein